MIGLKNTRARLGGFKDAPALSRANNTPRELDSSSLLFPRSEIMQTVLDLLAVLCWSVFGLVFGLGLFLATFFLFGSEF